jgi:ATP-dependent protease HslVU (ClpYQ) peptidase subunit
MTIIVGIADGTNVWIGGDRGSSDGDNILSMSTPKVFQRGEYLIGYSGSQGIGQLAKHIEIPAPTKNLEKSLRTLFTKSLKSAVEEYSNLNDDNNTDWLVGVHGHLFEISSSDWQVCEYAESAVGSGSSIALGSLHTSAKWKDYNKRVTAALHAAIDISPTCKGPIDILKI